MKKMLRTTLAIGGLFALACSSGDDPETTTEQPPPPPPVVEPTPPVEPAPPVVSTLEAGDIPYDFPRISSSAKAGQFALVPSREFLDRAIADDGEGTFIYYGATIITPASPESTIESLSGTSFTMPNSMIIPIRAGQKATKGDILLGHWESGSGLQRAIVVGGTETEPVVRYLDMDYDNPSGWGQKDDTWKPDRFSVLTEIWQTGTTLACGEGEDRKHTILIATSGSRILVSGFAGSISAHNRSECISLSPTATFADNTEVWVPVVGSYTKGTVSRTDTDTGRVHVTYDWGGQQKEGAFAIINVTANFTQTTGTVVSTPPPAEDGQEHPRAGKTAKIPKGTKGTGPRGRGKIGKFGGGNSDDNSDGSGGGGR